MSTSSFYIAYDGPALATHEMDVRDLSPALIALADAFDEANTILNGDRAKINLNVKGSFKTGCFGVDLTVAQSFMQSLLNLGAAPEVQSASSIATLFGFSGTTVVGLIQLIRWIRGQKIDRIEIEGTIATVWIGDKFLRVEEKIIRLLRSERIRKAMETAIKKPLENDGIDTFTCTATPDKSDMEIVSKDESLAFMLPKVEAEDLGETVYETQLQLISPTFQDGNKWRFSDGSTTFFAEMLDRDFIGKIDSHAIFFGKGDILTVRVVEKKKLESDGAMKAERFIIKVIAHRNASVHLKLTDQK